MLLITLILLFNPNIFAYLWSTVKEACVVQNKNQQKALVSPFLQLPESSSIPSNLKIK